MSEITITPKGQRFCSVDDANSHSPGISPFGGNVASVTVDGVEVDPKRCYDVSEPGGFVRCFKVTADGKQYCWVASNGESKVGRETLLGVVVLRLEGESL